jgi:PAS domain S-box-containing protein
MIIDHAPQVVPSTTRTRKLAPRLLEDLGPIAGRLAADPELARALAQVSDRYEAFEGADRVLQRLTLNVLDELATTCSALEARLADQKALTAEMNAFFRLSKDLIAVTDGALQMVQVNPAWEAQLGHQPVALLQHSLLEVVAPTDREKTERLVRQCLASGVPLTFDAGVLRGNQQRRAAQWSISADPTTQRLYVVIRDVTVRKRLERDLSEAQKLEAVGQLASGVAHEINTPVQFVGDNISFLTDAMRAVTPLLETLSTWAQGPVTDEARASVRERLHSADVPFLLEEIPSALTCAAEGVERVGELVRGLKEFSHPDGQRPEPADLNRALERTRVRNDRFMKCWS